MCSSDLFPSHDTLMYHETLIKWRKFVRELRKHNNKTTLLTDYKNILKNHSNFAYATVWGMWAPSRNRDYKDGPDIRPLKPTGEQNLRFAQLKFQEEEAKKIKAASDTIYKRSVQDFAHWTSATVDADPLWLLYYKRMLKPITQFPDTPQNFIEWRLKDQQTYETLSTTGTIKRLQEELDLIKEKYSMSRSMDMPRGKLS